MGDVEAEAMEVDDTGLHCVSVWFMPGLIKGNCRINLQQVDFKTVTTEKLKQLVLDEVKQNIEQEKSLTSAKDIDLLYRGSVLEKEGDTLESLKLRPNAVIHVVKNFTHKDEASGSTPTPEKPSLDKIREIAMALRTAFLSPAFLKTIEKLSEKEALQNLFAVAPRLETDLIGIAMIQNPQMLFQMSEREALIRLGETRPWVLDALCHIAAVVHAEKSVKPSRVPGNVMLSQLLNTAFDGEEDDMEEDEEPQASRTLSQPNLHGPITREQLAQALSAAVPAHLASTVAGGRGTGAPGTSFPNPAALRPTTAPPANPGAASRILGLNSLSQQQQSESANPAGGAASALQNLLQGQVSGTGTGPPAITADLVSRMIEGALRQLPPDARDQQYDIFRQLARQVAANPGTGPSQPERHGPVPPTTPATAAREYTQQLRQMRELGIDDERLSLLALEIADGDVMVASELIFSGFDGSGAERES